MTLAEVNASLQTDIIIPAVMSKHPGADYLRGGLRNDFKIVDMNVWDLGKIQQNESQVYLVPTFDARFLMKSVANRDHKWSFLKEGLVYSIDTYAAKRNFVFERRISSIIERIRQSRLLERYHTISFFEARQQGFLSKEQNRGVDKVKVVTFESLRSAFTVLGVGYVFAFLAFIFELNQSVPPVVGKRRLRHMKMKPQAKKIRRNRYGFKH